MAEEVLQVELVYAEPERVIRKMVRLPAGSRVEDAVLAAIDDLDFKSVDLSQSALGIYGVVVERDQPLRHGDRIEIYRPLAEDPKTARRKRARSASRASGRG